MTRRRRTCTISDARARYASASAFLDIADRLTAEEFDPDVTVTNAVHAGIAASDSLCCLRLGERSVEQDHVGAAKLLARIDRSLANDLTRLLSVKTTAAYETRRVTRTDARNAVRRARRLVAGARDALTRS